MYIIYYIKSKNEIYIHTRAREWSPHWLSAYYDTRVSKTFIVVFCPCILWHNNSACSSYYFVVKNGRLCTVFVAARSYRKSLKLEKRRIKRVRLSDWIAVKFLINELIRVAHTNYYYDSSTYVKSLKNNKNNRNLHNIQAFVGWIENENNYKHDELLFITRVALFFLLLHVILLTARRRLKFNKI